MSREQMKARLEAATPGPWFQGRDSNRWENATEVYSEREVSATSRDICTSVALPEDAALIAHAPTDLAKLHAALDAVEALAGKIDLESQDLGTDLEDDDFDRGWHGARRDAVDQIRNAIRDVLGEEDQ